MRIVGRYAVYDEIGRGGMAAVHLGRLLGHVGFSRTVAIKMLRPQYAKDPSFVSMFLDEARLAARIAHPNVVHTLDVEATQGELFVVMEYVHGESLSRLMRHARNEKTPIPLPIAVSLLSGVLLGLHAAHEAKGVDGEPLDLVHRDVSPDNILVGVDGIAKVADFGIAKARGRLQTTRTGELKGKVAYMAPEQLEGRAVRASDMFAVAIVLWEVLAGRRFFEGKDELTRMRTLLNGAIESPRVHAHAMPEALETVVMRGLERDPSRRFATGLEMATALERAVTPASAIDVAQWLETAAVVALERRSVLLARMEESSHDAFSQPALPSSEPTPGPVEAEEESEAGDPTRPVPGLAADSRFAIRDSRMANAVAPPPPRRRRLALFATLLVLATGVVLLATRKKEETKFTPLPVEAPSAAPVDADVPVDPVAPSAAPSVPPPPKGKARTTRPAAKPGKSDCTPPYTIGSDGLRHYKPECW
ncbi:serine/threonine protein kinase [Pendulispora rubella]|uniref:Serine/threonine protein kinase n=1 Tax=Pendulispora rubella TaxID=2741070 RepID=A0ABZ2KUN3_9BACT